MFWSAVVLTAVLAASHAPALAQGGAIRAVVKGGKGGKKGALGKGNLDRLSAMPTEQRERMLERLPPDRRKQMEKRLDQYQKLDTKQKERLVKAAEKLSPEQRKALRSLNGLSHDRRPIVRREVQSIRRMNAEERSARLASDEFKGKFDASEQQIIGELSSAAPIE